MAKKAKKKAKKSGKKKTSKKATKSAVKKKGAAKKPAKKPAKKKARRTVMYSSGGKKLYAKRDADGKFNDIQSYAKAHAADMRQVSKDEQPAPPDASPNS